MAVAVDAVSAVARLNAANNGTNVTAAITVGGGATHAVVFLTAGLLFSQSDASITFSTLTLGGNACTQLAGAKVHSGINASDNGGFLDIYTLATPPTGAQTLSVTMAYTGAGGSAQLIAYVVTYTGAGSISAAIVDATNGEFASSRTLVGGGAAADLIVGAAANGAAAPTMTTGTSDATTTGSTNTACDNLRVAHNAANANIVFACNTGDYSGATGVRLIAAGGAPSRPPMQRRRSGLWVPHAARRVR